MVLKDVLELLEAPFRPPPLKKTAKKIHSQCNSLRVCEVNTTIHSHISPLVLLSCVYIAQSYLAYEFLATGQT